MTRLTGGPSLTGDLIKRSRLYYLAFHESEVTYIYYTDNTGIDYSGRVSVASEKDVWGFQGFSKS